MVHRMNLNNLNNLNMNAKIEELLSTLKKKEDEKEILFFGYLQLLVQLLL